MGAVGLKETQPKGQLVKGEEDENNEKEGLSWLRGRRVAGREANSWGAAEREAGERRGESREVLSVFFFFFLQVGGRRSLGYEASGRRR